MIKHHAKVMSTMKIILYLVKQNRKVTTGEIQNHLNSNNDEHSRKVVLSYIRQCNDTFPNLINLHKADTNTNGSNDRNFYYVSINTVAYNKLIDSVISNVSIPSSSTHNFGMETNDNLYLMFRVLQIILDRKYNNNISFKEIKSLTKCSNKQMQRIFYNIESLLGASRLYVEENSLKVKNRDAIIKYIKH